MGRTNTKPLLHAFEDVTTYSPDFNSLKRPAMKAKQEYVVTMNMKVKNLTKWDLTNPQSFVKRGKLAHQPLAVPAGSLGQMLMHKTDLSWFGCIGAISWDVRNDEAEKQVVVFYHSPWGRGPQGNHLGVGITESSNNNIGVLFEEMSNRITAKEYFDVKKCGTETSVKWPRGNISVEGSLTDERHSTFTIVLYPANTEDIAPSLKKNYEENVSGSQTSSDSLETTDTNL